jgi:CubicO group peptidase (beta-lactamase class C family)
VTAGRSAATWLALLLVALCASGCRNLISPNTDPYTIPAQTGDGWVTASLADVDMDQAPLVALMKLLRSHTDHQIHSVLVVRRGKLVFEEYFRGQQFDLTGDDYRGRFDVAADRDALHLQSSVTKSITSALVGIAVDRGLLPGIDAKLTTFFPDYQAFLGPPKDRIELFHLLTMTAGWPWHDDDIDGDQSDEVLMFLNEDPVRFVLDRPLAHPPGSHMDYHSGSTVLLGEIVRRASGMDLHAFAERWLFGPLGIARTKWAHCPNAQDVAFAGGGLYMRPRDMAKIGQLYLQGGVWNGSQVVPTDWVRESVREAVTSHDRITDHLMFMGYGRLWWVGRFDGGVDAFLAAGWGGQFIIVVPAEDLVVVVTAGYFDDNDMRGPAGDFIFDDVVFHRILAAVR